MTIHFTAARNGGRASTANTTVSTTKAIVNPTRFAKPASISQITPERSSTFGSSWSPAAWCVDSRSLPTSLRFS
jgi:hypothetical protein